MAMIPVFSNDLGEEELAEVARVMKSRWIGTGDECGKFEYELCNYFGTDRIILTNCATSGIYLALRCLGIKPRDKVIIPTIHFIATANAVLEAGAEPLFADVDISTLNILPSEIERLGPAQGLILNHYGGHPCDMPQIFTQLIRRENSKMWLLEDAANAVASTYNGSHVGTLGDAGVWSFDAMKILSMGDGGALWFLSHKHHERAWRLRNLGLNVFSGKESAEKGAGCWWEFQVEEPSGRFDSNNLLACIGRVQLRRLHENINQRQRAWNFYQENLRNVGDLVLPPEPLPDCTTSYYLYWVQTGRRNELARFLYKKGIYTTFRYYPLHKALGIEAKTPNANYASIITLNLPLHQNLTDDNLHYIVETVREFYG
jgi:aminotransferase